MVTNLLTPTHIAIVLIVLLLILGPKRLPETGRALGSGIREFKQAITGHDNDSSPSQSPRLTRSTSTRDKTTSAVTEPSYGARLETPPAPHSSSAKPQT